jgi:hypothetical protein
MNLKRVILMSILRRLLGYAGVAGVVGIETDAMQLLGMIAAVGTFGWSIVEKIRESVKAE